jgi:hypothetical protein
MKHASYCLYRKKEKNCVMWYAKFWDYEKRRYWAYRTLKVRASGKYLRRTAAREAAEEMLGGLKKREAAVESFAGFLARFWERGGICESAHFLKTRRRIPPKSFQREWCTILWRTRQSRARAKT